MLIRDLPLEGSRCHLLVDLHLLDPFPEVELAAQPCHRLRLVHRVLRHCRVNVRDEFFGEQDLLPTEPHRDDSKDLIDDDVCVADHEEEDAHLLDPTTGHQPRTHRKHDFRLVLPGCVIEEEEQNVRVVSVMVTQPAHTFPDHSPDQVRTMHQGIVGEKGDEAIAKAVCRRELEAPLWQNARGVNSLACGTCGCCTSEAQRSFASWRRSKCTTQQRGSPLR